jgi:hypothetical protein
MKDNTDKSKKRSSFSIASELRDQGIISDQDLEMVNEGVQEIFVQNRYGEVIELEFGDADDNRDYLNRCLRAS